MSEDRRTTTEWLQRLVAFDTTSRNSNVGLIDVIRAHLEAHGITAHETRDASGQKANLHAVIGPAVAGGLALSGHVDTVPVDGQRWVADPFQLRERDAKLYGRGACDMKGFVASMLAAVPDLVAMKLARPIHLLITFDEETTMAGARRLIESFDTGPRPALCVVGEPSLMEPIVAHKGRLAVRAIVRGRAGHSADPSQGVNAIHYAAQVIAWVAREAAQTAIHGPFADGFQPPHTTSQVGTIAGGAVLNIIPEHCELTVEWRPIPGDDAPAALAGLESYLRQHVEPPMHAVDKLTGVQLEVTDWVPGMSLPPDHPLATAVRQAVGSNRSGHVSYATEGGLYQEAGIPTIVCGPGSIAQAHMPDEWIAVSELAACDRFIRRLASSLAA